VRPTRKTSLHTRIQPSNRNLCTHYDISSELQITEYANDYLMIDQRKLPPNLIMFANQVFCWEVEKASDVRLHHFDILKLISPKPGTPPNNLEFLIVALPHPENLDKEAVDYLQKNFQNADILPLVHPIASLVRRHRNIQQRSIRPDKLRDVHLHYLSSQTLTFRTTNIIISWLSSRTSFRQKNPNSSWKDCSVASTGSTLSSSCGNYRWLS